MNGKINGLRLSELSNDTIDGRKVFNLAEFSTNMAKEQAVDGFVIGKYLLKAFKTVVLVNKNETVNAHKNFQAITVQKKFNIKELATINNVVVSELANNGLYLRAKNNESENLIFNSNVTFKGYLTLLGQINGEALDDIVFVNEAANISGSKIFTAGIHMENDKKLNVIHVSGNMQVFIMQNCF